MSIGNSKTTKEKLVRHLCDAEASLEVCQVIEAKLVNDDSGKTTKANFHC